MAKKTNRRKSAKKPKKGSSGAYQQDFLDSLFGGGGSFPLAFPMNPLVPNPPKNIFPPGFLASAAHWGSNSPFGFSGSGGGGGGGEPPHGRTPPPPPGDGDKKDGGDGDKKDGDSKDSKERNKRLEKILRLLNLLTKGKARFFTDAIDALTGGKGLDSLPGAEALAKFAPAVAAFAMAVKAFDLIEKNREARGAVEQRAAALGFDAKKAFSADVQMKAFGGNFESIAKPMASWADAMTGVQMGDAGKFSNIMKQVAELSGMGYNVDLRHGSGKFGMASNEEFFMRMTDALSQALQKGDIGAQQKIQSIAGFDSSIADYLTSIKGAGGDSLLKHAFARENALPTLQRANKRQGRRSQSTFWEGAKDRIGAEFGAIGDAITGLNLFSNEPSPGELFLQKRKESNLPKKAKGGRETRPAIFAEAGPEWFIPEKNDENSRALLISAAQACGFDMFATGGKSSSGKARPSPSKKGNLSSAFSSLVTVLAPTLALLNSTLRVAVQYIKPTRGTANEGRKEAAGSGKEAANEARKPFFSYPERITRWDLLSKHKLTDEEKKERNRRSTEYWTRIGTKWPTSARSEKPRRRASTLPNIGLGFKGPNNDWRAKRRGLLGGSRTTAEQMGFKGPNHDWRLRSRTFDGSARTVAEQMGFKGPSPVNHNNSVVMNISNVEVSANDSKEFLASMLKVKKSPLSNVAKSVASSMDSKRIA